MRSRCRCRAASHQDPAVGCGWGMPQKHTQIPSFRWASAAPNVKGGKLLDPTGHTLCEFSEEGCLVPTPLPICWLWHLPKQTLCLHKTGLLNFEIGSGELGRALLLPTAEGMFVCRTLPQYQHFTQWMMRLGDKYGRERESCQDEAFSWEVEGWVYTFQRALSLCS